MMSSAGAITDVASIVTALSAVGTVLVAVYGLKTWRKQLKGSLEYEISKRLLLQAYKIREAVKHVRSPFLERGEAGEIPENATWEEAVYRERWKGVVEAFAGFDEALLEGTIIWGDDAEFLRVEMREHLDVLLDTLTDFASSKRDQTEPDEGWRQVLYRVNDEDDYSKGLAEIITKLEDYVKPKLGL